MRQKWNDRWKKWFNRDNLIVLVLSGVLLFVIALPTGDAKAGKKPRDGGTDMAADSLAAGGDEAGNSPVQTGSGEGSDYGRQQEERLEKILSAMEGVGKIEVMLTIASSEELVVEKDAPVNRSDTRETDSAGGTRSIIRLETGDSTVYRTADGDSSPYVIKTLSPRVEGVLVVAQGAGRGNVDRNITQAAQALFGVEAHKVKVVPMKDAR